MFNCDVVSSACDASCLPSNLIHARAGDARRLAVDVKLLGNSTAVAFETVERHLSILADLDEVAVRITHIATPFPTVIV